MKREIRVEYKNVDKLIPYANNPRNNDNAVEAVANSIKEFGFGSPIIIDEKGEIINGHTRLKAAKFLELKEVPTVTIDWLTEEQKKAYRLADNKVSEIAEWDYELLEAELGLFDFDMEQFGFDDIKSELEKKLEDDKTPKTMYLNDKDIIAIECDSEEELELTFMKLQEEGYNCQILTL